MRFIAFGSLGFDADVRLFIHNLGYELRLTLTCIKSPEISLRQ